MTAGSDIHQGRYIYLVQIKCYNVHQLLLYNVMRSDNKMATDYETLRNFTRFMTAFEQERQSVCFHKKTCEINRYNK